MCERECDHEREGGERERAECGGVEREKKKGGERKERERREKK